MLRNVVSNCVNEYNIKCSIVVKNLTTGEDFTLNETQVMPSASIIKIFIMGEIFNKVSKNEISLEDKIVISQGEKVPYSILTLFDEEKEYTVRELLKLMICQSENTATNKLIDIAGMDNVNLFIRSLGLEHCELQRKMIDIEARKQGRENYISVLEVSNFLELLYEGRVIDESSSKSMIDIMKQQLLVAEVHRYIPDDIEIALKTGDIWGYKHASGIFYIDNCHYIFTILTNYETPEQLAQVDDFISKMSSEVYFYFKNKRI